MECNSGTREGGEEARRADSMTSPNPIDINSALLIAGLVRLRPPVLHASLPPAALAHLPAKRAATDPRIIHQAHYPQTQGGRSATAHQPQRTARQ